MYWALQRVEDREQFLYHLERPIPGRVGTADTEREREEFSAFMAGLGGG